jgi:hypothetical protein
MKTYFIGLLDLAKLADAVSHLDALVTSPRDKQQVSACHAVIQAVLGEDVGTLYATDEREAA